MAYILCIRNFGRNLYQFKNHLFLRVFFIFLGVYSWEHEGYHYILPFKELIEIQGGGDVKPSRIWRNDLQSNQRYLDKIQKSVKWRYRYFKLRNDSFFNNFYVTRLWWHQGVLATSMLVTNVGDEVCWRQPLVTNICVAGHFISEFIFSSPKKSYIVGRLRLFQFLRQLVDKFIVVCDIPLELCLISPFLKK